VGCRCMVALAELEGLRPFESGNILQQAQQLADATRVPPPSVARARCGVGGASNRAASALRYLWIAAAQLSTTVSGAATLDFGGVALTRKRCPSLVTA
jgi:hypothetical protein